MGIIEIYVMHYACYLCVFTLFQPFTSWHSPFLYYLPFCHMIWLLSVWDPEEDYY